jgi:hypothetical protein
VCGSNMRIVIVAGKPYPGRYVAIGSTATCARRSSPTWPKDGGNQGEWPSSAGICPDPYAALPKGHTCPFGKPVWMSLARRHLPPEATTSDAFFSPKIEPLAFFFHVVSG